MSGQERGEGDALRERRPTSDEERAERGGNRAVCERLQAVHREPEPLRARQD